ncbi:unnamed protein product, partial [Effrenium voratum]
EADNKQLQDWEKKADEMLQVNDVTRLEKDLLDLLIGFSRVMPSFVGFPALQNAFKTPEAQVKVVLKVVKNLRVVLKKMQLDKLPAETQPKVRSLVVYVYCLVQEAWNTYGASAGMGPAAFWAKGNLEEEEFDEYADEFEEHLVSVLEYNLPEVLAGRLSRASVRFRRALDLGCGTGLCGRALRRRAALDRLEGVDLSGGMLKRARERGGYDQLWQRDLLAQLQREEAKAADLLVAADVFIYVGALDQVFREAYRVLEEGGLFVFSTELAHEDDTMEDMVKRESGRYAHKRSYIERLAAGDADQPYFSVEVEALPLRIEDDLPLEGELFMLQRLPHVQR